MGRRKNPRRSALFISGRQERRSVQAEKQGKKNAKVGHIVNRNRGSQWKGTQENWQITSGPTLSKTF